MSDGEGPQGPRLISTRAMDIVVALLMLGAAAVVMTDSLRLGMGWQENEGPRAGYFPFYIGVILGVASFVNLLRAVFDAKGSQKTFTTKPAIRQVLAVLIPLAIYVAAVGFIGIYVASAIYMALFMWYFGKYPIWRGALIGCAVSFVFFLMFEIWFLVPLPKGPLEIWLGY
jgi:putative tricarboxylic transport membrane protein